MKLVSAVRFDQSNGILMICVEDWEVKSVKIYQTN